MSESTTAPGEPGAPEIPGFTFDRLIGTGGFSDVYLYRQELPRRDVAIKVLRTESITDTTRRQFTAEVNLMARLSSHPTIATIHSAGVTEQGQPYLVLEFYPGGSLGAVYRKAPLDVPRVLQIGVKLATALETAHRAGIVHRDIKPANVLVSEYGSAVLTDFGISAVDEEFPEATMAKASVYATASSLEDMGSEVGLSLPWAAPETLNTPPTSDSRSDRYALAATLYSLLHGRSPHEMPGEPSHGVAMVQRILTGRVAPFTRPDLPPSLVRVLRQGMAFERTQRFSSTLAMARALQSVEIELGLPPTSIEVAPGPTAEEVAAAKLRDDARRPAEATAARAVDMRVGGPPVAFAFHSQPAPPEHRTPTPGQHTPLPPQAPPPPEHPTPTPGSHTGGRGPALPPHQTVRPPQPPVPAPQPAQQRPTMAPAPQARTWGQPRRSWTSEQPWWVLTLIGAVALLVVVIIAGLIVNAVASSAAPAEPGPILDPLALLSRT